MAYFPELYGVYAVAALIDILDGRAVPQEIHIDHVWINRDNVDQYYNTEGFPIHSLGPSAELAATAADMGGRSDLDARRSGRRDVHRGRGSGVDRGQRGHVGRLAALTLIPAGRGGLAPAPCGEQ